MDGKRLWKTIRATIRVASNSTLTSCEIVQKAGITANVRSSHRVLEKGKFIQRLEMKQKPPLTKQHEEERLTVSRKRIYLNKKWKRILFIDENKFNMDGPDGFSFYYHDLREAEIINKRRQMNRNRIMIWNRIEYKGKTDVWFLEGKMNSQKDINLMREEINTYNELR